MRKNVLICVLFIVISIMCVFVIKQNDILKEIHDDIRNNVIDVEKAGDSSQVGDILQDEGNQTISMFSWHFELTNQPMFYQMKEVLVDLNVNRIYQNISERNIKEPQMRLMIQNLAECGIEIVALTGDKSWVYDGLDEYIDILKSINQYNEALSEEYKIKKIALDVEVHCLEEWDENEEKLFEQYVDLMREAKEEAEKYGLKIIQIIPPGYDVVDEEMFQIFLQECCDEISIMNYDKRNADNAISYEVEMCSQYAIPIEMVFETMPVSEEYDVTENLTYFYEGIDALREEYERLKDIYGNELGVGYHHFTTVYEIITKQKMGEIYCSSFDWENKINPGNLLLYGNDGSKLFATPYWSKGRKHKGEISWLVCGVKEEVPYEIIYYDLFQEVKLTSEAYFIQGDDLKLELLLEEEYDF